SAGWMPPHVRHAVRLRRLRAGGGSPRHRAGSRGQVARLRGEPVRDLRLLHPALHGAGSRGAGKHHRLCRALAAERGLRAARRDSHAAGWAGAAGRSPRAHVAGWPASRARERGPGGGSLTVSGGRRVVLPVIGRRVAVEFLRAFALTVLAFLAIYVLADFFDRFDSFLAHDARPSAIIRLFLYRMPLIVTQVTP